jgi:hypothetical protein
MKNSLTYIEIWLKLILNYFDKHKIQGTIFFISLMLCLIEIGFFIGLAIYDKIKYL